MGVNMTTLCFQLLEAFRANASFAASVFAGLCSYLPGLAERSFQAIKPGFLGFFTFP
jgi:hypothetical protein